MRIDLSRHVPLGLNGKKEIQYLAAGLGIAAAWSVIDFAKEYTDALAMLYGHRAGGSRVLIPGQIIGDFEPMLAGGSVLFSLICLAMALLAGYHYAYHFQGSKSVYLMRRLPGRYELPHRCFAIPAAGAVGAMALLGLLTVCYYAVYLLCTPAQCLP